MKHLRSTLHLAVVAVALMAASAQAATPAMHEHAAAQPLPIQVDARPVAMAPSYGLVAVNGDACACGACGTPLNDVVSPAVQAPSLISRRVWQVGRHRT